MNIYYKSFFKSYSKQFEMIIKEFVFVIEDEFLNNLDSKVILYFREKKYKNTRKNSLTSHKH